MHVYTKTVLKCSSLKLTVLTKYPRQPIVMHITKSAMMKKYKAELVSAAPRANDMILATEAKIPPMACPETRAEVYCPGNIPTTPNRAPWNVAPAPGKVKQLGFNFSIIWS